MQEQPVVVGLTDEQSPNVIRFALDEAYRRRTSLRIVHVVAHTRGADEIIHQPDGHALKQLEHVPVERVTLFGEATEVLLAECDRASCLVLGADDPGRAPTRRSEVAQQVALHATIPVIVVPLTAIPRGPAPLVLLAVDHAHTAAGQIAYAIEAAEERGTSLDVVAGAGVTSDYPGRMADTLRLEDVIDPWRQAHPNLPIRVLVEGGHPVDSCLEAASHACLIVVGRPESKHPRIGSRSVAASILRRAEVPVAVVPHSYEPSDAAALAPL